MSAEVIALGRRGVEPEVVTDETLLAACARQDADALGVLFDRHHTRLHAFLRRISGVEGGEAEDLLQETFTQVWISAGRFRGGSKALTWIFGVAVNVARAHTRKRRRGLRALLSLASLEPPPVDASDVVAERNESMRRLGQGLEALSADQRVVFVLCDLEGVPGVDVAKTLGVPPGTVWRRLHEARSALRRSIGEEGP